MKVRISFEIPDLTLVLDDDEIEALQDEFSWEPFYEILEDKILAHAESFLVIDDVMVLS